MLLVVQWENEHFFRGFVENKTWVTFLSNTIGVWYGNCRRRGILTFARSMTSFEVPCLLFFLGKVFGRLRPLRTSPSLFGLQLGRRFLPGTFCGVEALILLTGALCVVVMGRRWIICFSIVKKLISCGVWFLDWNFLGLAKISCRYAFQLVELVWKALF